MKTPAAQLVALWRTIVEREITILSIETIQHPPIQTTMILEAEIVKVHKSVPAEIVV